ncbi:hypothetical protein RB595_002781 [Gaeumannomyces hyphopodioides]
MATTNPEAGDPVHRKHHAHFTCANHGRVGENGSVPCIKKAKSVCGRCGLVAYCGDKCKKKHAQQHKKDCESELLKPGWQPGWTKEGRVPSFMTNGGGQPFTPFGFVNKFLWGNVPAIDVIKLQSNEGVVLKQDLDVLFAASGDLRNVVMSISQLPGEYKHSAAVVLNDISPEVVARNAIFLLIFATAEDKDVAAECVLHLFYSTFVAESHMQILKSKVQPLVREVCEKTSAKTPDAVLAKTWTFGVQGDTKVRLVLTRRQWLDLLAMLEAPRNLEPARAKALRDRVVNAPERVDYRERHMFRQVPNSRMAYEKFRSDGILLPFGASRAGFLVPNPTIFGEKEGWPMQDSADPCAGWSLPVVLRSQKGLAKGDRYGALYEYVLERFCEFHDQLAVRKVSFELHCVDARLLKGLVGDRKFDRIDTSNISDENYVGIAETLGVLGPLLKSSEVNDKATIVTNFLNAVPCTAAMLGDMYKGMEMIENLPKVMPYFFNPPGSSRGQAPEIIVGGRDPATSMFLIATAIDMARDMDYVFEAYMIGHRFDEAAAAAGVEMKKSNTIVEKWPIRFPFTSDPLSAKARKAFALMLSSGHIGHERYVEWRAVRNPQA